MKKYEIRQSERFSKIFPGETRYIIINNELPNNPVFSGYDLMGSPEWNECELCAYFMDREEAETILDDLEAAEDEVETNPADKQYLVKTDIDGEPINRVMTGREVATLYEDDQLSGIYGDIKVWDISRDEPKRVSVIDLVDPILENKRWMEQEYRDYCENERY